MRPRPPAAPPRAAALAIALAALLAAVLAVPRTGGASVVPGALVLRAEGRAPVVAGRSDTAFQRALDEAFRRVLLEALRSVAPERQSPADLEGWQRTILARAPDFVGAWRILGQEEAGGFLRLQVEAEVWREKLAAAVLLGGGTVRPFAVRVLVLADPFPVPGRGEAEEVDAGQAAALALEAELARRGAVVLAALNRTPWRHSAGPGSEENRVGLAALEGKRLQADALVILGLARRGGDRLLLTAQLVAASSETTLASPSAELELPPDAEPAAAFAPAARRLAAALAPRLEATQARWPGVSR